jgi:hypothetical protein
VSCSTQNASAVCTGRATGCVAESKCNVSVLLVAARQLQPAGLCNGLAMLCPAPPPPQRDAQAAPAVLMKLTGLEVLLAKQPHVVHLLRNPPMRQPTRVACASCFVLRRPASPAPSVGTTALRLAATSSTAATAWRMHRRRLPCGLAVSALTGAPWQHGVCTVLRCRCCSCSGCRLHAGQGGKSKAAQQRQVHAVMAGSHVVLEAAARQPVWPLFSATTAVLEAPISCACCCWVWLYAESLADWTPSLKPWIYE